MIIYHGGIDPTIYGEECSDIMLTYYDFHKSGKPDKRLQAIIDNKSGSKASRIEEFPSMKVKDQKIGDRYALYNGDSCQVLPKLPAESVGFILYSPPFANLFSYSDEPEDLSNCTSYENFFEHFKFMADEMFRLLQPGRMMAVHCMDLPTFKRDGEEIGMQDFSGDLVKLFRSCGFIYQSRHCIWKDPLEAAFRTKAIGLAHKQIVKDSTMSRAGIPDYILGFRKPGINLKPVKNEHGLTHYPGSRPIPAGLDRYKDETDQRLNKRSQWIWQQLASPVWFDIRQTKVLPFRGAKGVDDETHICPLALDTVERCMMLWSAPDDVVLDPFSGVGTTVYMALKTGRRAIGVELRPRYHRQMLKNVAIAIKKQKESVP